MNILSIVGACMVGSSFLGISFELIRSEKARIRRNLTLVFKRCNIQKDKQFPRIQKIYPSGEGWGVDVRLPVGISLKHIEKHREEIESATNSEMEVWTEGQILRMVLYCRRIPDSIDYNEWSGGGILLGYGRRGPETIDLLREPNPHIMIGGASGMGKSNVLNLIIRQLQNRKRFRLHLIDTKRVEFSRYEGKVHTVAKDLLDAGKAVRQIVTKMKEKEKLLEERGLTDVSQLDHPEYDVLVVDEFSDFADSEAFWKDIDQIARKGRALGSFLCLATQRPSADVLPPSVKANLGIKIALRTTTESNSRVLIDCSDAFRLPYIRGRALLVTDRPRQIQIPKVEVE
jgi:DNA segregation ATPase FtsK/SpoIIIE-like protein